MIIYRPHAMGMTLDEAMERQRSFDTADELRAFIITETANLGRKLQPDQITSEPYGPDARVGWDTHIVLIDGHACGFADAPLPAVENKGQPGARFMVDRVMNAIIIEMKRQSEAGTGHVDADDQTDAVIDGHFDLRKTARAAIEAMREPTIYMHNAAALAGLCGKAPTIDVDSEGRLGLDYALADASAVYRAMIDKALE